MTTSIDVERLFSRGHLLLSHVRSRLSVQSTWTLLCLGFWSQLNFIKPEDVNKVTMLPDVEGEEQEMAHGWDNRNLTLTRGYTLEGFWPHHARVMVFGS
ncbi:hypothetical protein AZE42_11296 [Rhizopogon vesiculosus]|uniref:HAT C-terminal dimerisation domain-containing protein n=1 Tax=Rhizopogon vesiculosus TaxID=180088 RepID=A0A1J8QP73_9AGAM|nr:hypothetical protein AZE42_11296 [Rhizopogon vesiculosus]